MKRWLAILILLGLAPNSASANPIGSPYVCVPPIQASQDPLEFRIREGQACREGETLMKVQIQGGEKILLLPAPPPLSPEENEVLENYKRYHGLTP